MTTFMCVHLSAFQVLYNKQVVNEEKSGVQETCPGLASPSVYYRPPPASPNCPPQRCAPEGPILGLCTCGVLLRITPSLSSTSPFVSSVTECWEYNAVRRETAGPRPACRLVPETHSEQHAAGRCRKGPSNRLTGTSVIWALFQMGREGNRRRLA